MGSLVSKACLNCAAPLPEGSLTCAFCGSSHVLTAEGFQSACQGCGAGNPPHAKHCVQCTKPLLLPCPECAALNPLGSRYCHDCTIEFASYKDPHYQVAENTVPLEAVDERVKTWLEGRWFKARDIATQLQVLERTLFWVPVWRFFAEAKGHVQGQVSQTHYRSVSHKRFVSDGQGGGDWQTEVDSEPYTVWNDVQRDFQQPISVSLRAADPEGTEPLYRALGEPWKQKVPCACSTAPGRGRLRARVRARARAAAPPTTACAPRPPPSSSGPCSSGSCASTCAGVQPALSLTFYPVWSVLYRYKRKQGTLQLDGVTGEGHGKRISLLTQWLS
ncbi:MAG: zinc ribbon domain-containing protein [Planctomycetota bacterium]